MGTNTVASAAATAAPGSPNHTVINGYFRGIEHFDSICSRLRILAEKHIRSPKEGYMCHMDLCFEYQALWHTVCQFIDVDPAFYSNLRTVFGRLTRELQAICMLKSEADIEQLVTSTFARTFEAQALARTYLPEMTRLYTPGR